MSDIDKDPEFTVTAVPVEEVMDFVWRITDFGEGEIRIEVGDRFVLNEEMFGNDVESFTAQIGVSSMVKVAQLIGLTKQEAKALTVIAMEMAGAV